MSEKIYDSEVAPLLKKAAELCREHGMPLLAICEYEFNEFGRTESLTDNMSIAMTMAIYAARCAGNFDALGLAMIRKFGSRCKESVFLSKMVTEGDL